MYRRLTKEINNTVWLLKILMLNINIFNSRTSWPNNLILTPPSEKFLHENTIIDLNTRLLNLAKFQL